MADLLSNWQFCSNNLIVYHQNVRKVSWNYEFSRKKILTWFDVLDMGVPAPEEMAGCEYIMSDLIGGKTWCEAEDTTGCFISIATKASEARLNNPWSLRLPNISLCNQKVDFSFHRKNIPNMKFKCHTTTYVVHTALYVTLCICKCMIFLWNQ